MRSWWVNQNQTYKHEIEGGYLWSPRTNRNGARNQFYENMRLVEPGDIVFSFSDTKISQVGRAVSRAIPCPKPEEFGDVGANWGQEGWLVEIAWKAVPTPIRPKDNIEALKPHLPAKYSPLTQDGNGLQSIYLAAVPEAMAAILMQKLGFTGSLLGEIASIAETPVSAATTVEVTIEKGIRNDTTIDTTTRDALIQARRGQGRFRRNLEGIERGCRITGVTDRRLLRASHIKPWRVCETNHERLDGNNGLLLTPTFDALFDGGYISFAEDGRVLIGDAIAQDQLAALGLGNPAHTAPAAFSKQQATYLEYHRRVLFDRKA
jgi:putative restriction endonuclease